jgi:hypothetical protein
MGVLTRQRVGSASTCPPELGEVPLLVNPLIKGVPIILALAGQPVADRALAAPLILPLFVQFFG